MKAETFGSQHRLLTAAQFAEVFAARRVLRGDGFNLHYRANELDRTRLGLVVPKRQARSAVLRNAVKRQARETFRHMRSILPPADLILRLSSPVRAHDPAARRAWRNEISVLFERLAKKAGVPAQ